jgi:hypothetical protein
MGNKMFLINKKMFDDSVTESEVTSDDEEF